MRPETQQAIQVLRDKIRAKEEEAMELKKVVNGLFNDENEPAPYADITSDSSAAFGVLRTDHFYGHTLAEAAQEYLEMRKSGGLGSASVNDIYKALKEGGYRFDTATEEYAKNGVRISLKKNPTIFHQLPGGDYGLCKWYGIKGGNGESRVPRKRHGKHRKRQSEPKPPETTPTTEPNAIQNAGTDTKEAMRLARGTASSTGVITVDRFEAFVREKNRHMKDIAEHFGVTKEVVTNMLEPQSKVYIAERGWLKIRE